MRSAAGEDAVFARRTSTKGTRGCQYMHTRSVPSGVGRSLTGCRGLGFPVTITEFQERFAIEQACREGCGSSEVTSRPGSAGDRRLADRGRRGHVARCAIERTRRPSPRLGAMSPSHRGLAAPFRGLSCRSLAAWIPNIPGDPGLGRSLQKSRTLSGVPVCVSLARWAAAGGAGQRVRGDATSSAGAAVQELRCADFGVRDRRAATSPRCPWTTRPRAPAPSPETHGRCVERRGSSVLSRASICDASSWCSPSRSGNPSRARKAASPSSRRLSETSFKIRCPRPPAGS